MTGGNYLKALLSRARRLNSSALPLSAIFTEEADRLSRLDEASRLKASYSFISQQLGWAKRDEDAASYSHSQANLIASLGGLAVGSLIKIASRNKQLSASADYLLKGLSNKERPFGLVLIGIGPKGLPDGAEVISISQLARDSNQEEAEVINKLREGGYLLFNEKAFSLLIDRLIEDIREGQLRLPVSREKLSEIIASGESNLELRK